MATENWGMALSRAGYNYYDGDQHLVFNSGKPLMRIAQQGSGTFSFTTSDSYKSVSIPHDLGYTPIPAVYCQSFNYDVDDVDEEYYPMSFGEEYVLQMFGNYQAYTDDDYLHVSVTLNAPALGNVDLNYFYLLYYNPLYETELDLLDNLYPENWGMLFSLAGKSATLARKIDRTFSSGDETHEVHESGTTTSSPVSHDLGKPVHVDSYYYDGSDVWKGKPYVTDTEVGMTVSTKAFYVIFREGAT